VALSATDTICRWRGEHDVITCALRLEEILWMGSNWFPCVCMWGHPQSHNDQLLIMTMGEGLEYDDLENVCSLLHFFFKVLFSCRGTERDKGDIGVMSCLVFQACLDRPCVDASDWPNNLIGRLHSCSFHTSLYYSHEHGVVVWYCLTLLCVCVCVCVCVHVCVRAALDWRTYSSMFLSRLS